MYCRWPESSWASRPSLSLIFELISLSWTVFFQAEDGIRDYKVTGVQTCALPICPPIASALSIRRREVVGRVDVEGEGRDVLDDPGHPAVVGQLGVALAAAHPERRRDRRSEERRVGKEGGGRRHRGRHSKCHRRPR